jgi:hypothetical protein
LNFKGHYDSVVTADLEKRLQATFAAARKPGAPEWFLQRLDPLQSEVQQLVRAELKWEPIAKDLAPILATHLTESELREAIVFYESPTGRKLSATAPELAGRLKEIGKVRAELNLELIAKDLAPSLASFTESELRELIAFSESSTGRKLSATAPEIKGRIEELGNVQRRELTLKVTELIKKRMQQEQ